MKSAISIPGVALPDLSRNTGRRVSDPRTLHSLSDKLHPIQRMRERGYPLNVEKTERYLSVHPGSRYDCRPSTTTVRPTSGDDNHRNQLHNRRIAYVVSEFLLNQHTVRWPVWYSRYAHLRVEFVCSPHLGTRCLFQLSNRSIERASKCPCFNDLRSGNQLNGWNCSGWMRNYCSHKRCGTSQCFLRQFVQSTEHEWNRNRFVNDDCLLNHRRNACWYLLRNRQLDITSILTHLTRCSSPCWTAEYRGPVFPKSDWR
jgi:hypothetical protein